MHFFIVLKIYGICDNRLHLKEHYTIYFKGFCVLMQFLWGVLNNDNLTIKKLLKYILKVIQKFSIYVPLFIIV